MPLFDSKSRAESAFSSSPVYTSSRSLSGAYTFAGAPNSATSSQGWDAQAGYSPTDSVDDILASPNLSDYGLDSGAAAAAPAKPKHNGKGRPQRRPSNRDEFDGPHQFLQRPPATYIAMQERELPHLPTNLLVQEQDSVLNAVNERLSQCAYDFVAKYQFPIPLTQDMRPVERPQDREWTEWVYLLKRLATKRRIPVSRRSRPRPTHAPPWGSRKSPTEISLDGLGTPCRRRLLMMMMMMTHAPDRMNADISVT